MRTTVILRVCVSLVLVAVVVNGMPSSEMMNENEGDQSTVNNEVSNISDTISNDVDANNTVADETQIPAPAENTITAALNVTAQSNNANTTATTTTAAATATEASGTYKEGEPDAGKADSLVDYFLDWVNRKAKPSSGASNNSEKVESDQPTNASAPESSSAQNVTAVNASMPDASSAQNASFLDASASDSSSSQNASLPVAPMSDSSSAQNASLLDAVTFDSPSVQNESLIDSSTPDFSSTENVTSVGVNEDAGSSITSTAGTGEYTSEVGDFLDDEGSLDNLDSDDYKNASEDSSSYEDFWTLKDQCDSPVDLNDFCIVDYEVQAWFKDDITMRGLRESIFDMTLVEQLANNCPRGVWCLNQELNVHAVKHRLNIIPLMCLDMWECFGAVLIGRENCTDRDTADFRFFLDAAELLCEVTNAKRPKHPNLCLLNTMAALHVMYADFLAYNNTFPEPEFDVSCGGPALNMVNSYICSDKCNTGHKNRLRTLIQGKYDQPGCSAECNEDIEIWTTTPTPFSATDDDDYNNDSDIDNDYGSDNYDDYDNNRDNVYADDYNNDNDNEYGNDNDHGNDNDDAYGNDNDNDYGYDNDNDNAYGNDNDNDYGNDNDNDYGNDNDSDYTDDYDSDYDSDSSDSDEDDWYDYSTVTSTGGDVDVDSMMHSTTESYYPASHDHFNQDKYEGDSMGEEDESLMLALTVATAVGLMFMVLGLVFWRRHRRRHLYYSHGDGYSRLPDDVGPLLPKTSSE